MIRLIVATKGVCGLKNIIDEVYGPMLREHGFTLDSQNTEYGDLWQCWKVPDKMGSGYYWTYGQKNLFNMKIHHFYFHEDSFMEFNMPECLSITYYDSISGEELLPYRRLTAKCIKSYLGGYEPYKAIIHKKIPVSSIGIEILPAYYEDYLQKTYPGKYDSPYEAFRNIGQTSNFTEMILLLNQVRSYRGDGIAAQLFYEAKVAESVSLVVERQKLRTLLTHKSKISPLDKQQLEIVTAYINDHYASELPLARLAKIACMGSTKLKLLYKQFHGHTITDYIQERRMGQAEHMLTKTDLSIGQIAQIVGYKSASRFAELFKKSTGLLPGEFRKIGKR